MKRIALLLLGLALSNGIFAADARLRQALDHFMNLEYGEALELFRKRAAERPEDLEARNCVAQTILYRELYRVGALESELVSGSNPFLRRPKVDPGEEDRKEFSDAVNWVIERAEKRLESDPDDVRALYLGGVAYGLRSNYNFLIEKAWMDALGDATKSRKMHSRVVQMNHGHIDARMIPAMHEYVVGSLPWYIKMVGFLAGFRGDKELGIKELELVASRGGDNLHNARVLLCAVYRRERRPADAVPVLKVLIDDFPRNHLFRLELVQMYSDLEKKDEALAVLRQMQELKRSGAPGYNDLPEEKILFSRGTLLFWYRDYEQARQDLRRVTANPEELTLNNAVLAWLRRGQIADLLGQREEALTAYREAIRLAPESDHAGQARDFLRKPSTEKTKT